MTSATTTSPASAAADRQLLSAPSTAPSQSLSAPSLHSPGPNSKEPGSTEASPSSQSPEQVSTPSPSASTQTGVVNGEQSPGLGVATAQPAGVDSMLFPEAPGTTDAASSEPSASTSVSDPWGPQPTADSGREQTPTSLTLEGKTPTPSVPTTPLPRNAENAWATSKVGEPLSALLTGPPTTTQPPAGRVPDRLNELSVQAVNPAPSEYSDRSRSAAVGLCSSTHSRSVSGPAGSKNTSEITGPSPTTADASTRKGLEVVHIAPRALAPGSRVDACQGTPIRRRASSATTGPRSARSTCAHVNPCTGAGPGIGLPGGVCHEAPLSRLISSSSKTPPSSSASNTSYCTSSRPAASWAGRDAATPANAAAPSTSPTVARRARVSPSTPQSSRRWLGDTSMLLPLVFSHSRSWSPSPSASPNQSRSTSAVASAQAASLPKPPSFS